MIQQQALFFWLRPSHGWLQLRTPYNDIICSADFISPRTDYACYWYTERQGLYCACRVGKGRIK